MDGKGRVDIDPRSKTGTETEEQSLSDWVYGFIFLGASLMLLIGCLDLMQGIVAVLDENFYVPKAEYPFEIDPTLWGWLHIVSGSLMIIAALGLVSGSAISRVLAIGLAFLSAVWSFYSIPYYPVWSIVILLLDVGLIWIIAKHGGQLAREAGAYSGERSPSP
jgi:hypothetical protein